MRPLILRETVEAAVGDIAEFSVVGGLQSNGRASLTGRFSSRQAFVTLLRRDRYHITCVPDDTHLPGMFPIASWVMGGLWLGSKAESYAPHTIAAEGGPSI